MSGPPDKTPTPDDARLSGSAAQPEPDGAREQGAEMAEHRIIEVREHPATEPGALDGWEAVCTCGYTMAASLKGIASGYGIAHVAYMSAKAERQAR